MVAGVKEKAFTIALVNNGSLNQKLQLKLDGFLISKRYKKFIYSNNVRPVNGSGFPVPQETGSLHLSGEELSVDVPAKSFILYTTFNF